MPSTMAHLRTERVPQADNRVLLVGDNILFNLFYLPSFAGFELVSVGKLGFSSAFEENNPAEYPWGQRMLAQLNTAWVPRCILLQCAAVPGASLTPNLTQAQYDAGWSALVNAAQTSTARVIVLVHAAVDIGAASYAMLHALPADEWLDLPPFNYGGTPWDTWDTGTYYAEAAIIANLIWSGA